MKKLIYFTVTATIVFVLSESVLSSSLNFDIKQKTLDNGMKILVVERHNSPTVSIWLLYKVGSVNEVTGRTGISHFIEHLHFKGTKKIGTINYPAEVVLMSEQDKLDALIQEETSKRNPDEKKIAEWKAKIQELETEQSKYIISNEIDKIYTEAGAKESNAWTDWDYTTYFENLPSNKFELWCAVQSDIMQNVVFREFYSERDVVAEERRMYNEDDPLLALDELMGNTAFTVHPYANDIGGSMSDIQRFSREAVYDYYRKYYAPNRAIVAIVGDIKAENAFSLISKYFSHIPRQPEPPPVISVEPVQRGERRVELEYDASPILEIAYHKTELSHPDTPVFDVIAEVLIKGETSRFYRKLVEDERTAVSITCYNRDSKYPGLFGFVVIPRSPHTITDNESLINEEIQKLMDEKISEWELQRAKNRLVANFLYDLRSNDSLSYAIGFYEALDCSDIFKNLPQAWNAVTAEDVQRVAKQYLRRSNRTVAYIVSMQSTKEDE